jgi:PAS domain S-box-containing protein
MHARGQDLVPVSSGENAPGTGGEGMAREAELRRINQALHTLRSCNQALIRATDEAHLLGEICRVIVEQGGYRMAWVGFAENDAARTVRPVASAGYEAGYLETLHITWADEPRGRGPTGTAIRTRQPAVCRDMHTDPRFAPWREDALRRGYAASIVLPLLEQDAVIGAISIYATEPTAFDAEEVRLLQGLAEDLVFGIRTLRSRLAHRESTEALRRASAYNRSLIDASLDPLATIGPDGRITDVNAATEQVTGRSRGDLIGTDFSEYFTEPGKARAGYLQVLREGFVRDYPLELRHRDGRVASVLYNASVYRDEAGHVVGVFAAARDITALRRAEAEVRAAYTTLEQRVAERTRELATSEERLRSVLQATATGTFEVDLRTGEGWWNDVEYALLGLKPGEAPSRPESLFRYVHPDDIGLLGEKWEQAKRSGELDAEFRVVHAGGEVRWLAGKGHFIKERPAGGEGEQPETLVRFLGVNYDITERKQAEETLREIRQDLDRAQQVAQIGSWRLDVRRNRLTWSEENHRIFGVPPGTPLTYESFLALVHPDDRADVDRQWKAGLEGATYDIEHRIVVDGRVKWVREKAYLEFDKAGRLLGGFGITQDITVRKQAEQALRESERRLSLAVHAAQAGIWDWDMANGRLDWSPELFRMFGLDPDRSEASFETWRDILHPADRDGAEARIQEAIAQHTRLENEYRIVLPAGEIRWIAALGDATHDGAGRPQRMIGVCLDITGRKRSELELRKLAAELQATNAELESFSYSVSHDLRAPLRSIDGFSRILLKQSADKLDEESRENLHRVRAASQRMGELIDDLLQLSRAVRVGMQAAPLDLGAIACSTIERLQEAEPARRVECVVAPDLQASGDPSLVRVVLENLLNNAWKFTAKRTDARIEVGAEECDGERAFFVRDNGAGFDAAYADKLFGAFQRLHGQDEFPGHGIGLATVQRIIRRHGGRVWAEGKVGEGAVFHFTLSEQPRNP